LRQRSGQIFRSLHNLGLNVGQPVEIKEPEAVYRTAEAAQVQRLPMQPLLNAGR
jgi:hypothetical protein